MRAVDLFAGCGGTTCGLIAAGLDVRLGIDNDAAALAVLRANHDHATLQMDLGNVQRAVQAIEKVGPIDLLCASPPCPSGERVEWDSLTAAFARIAVAIGPRCVWIESGRGLLQSHEWEQARDVFVNNGYSITILRVNSAACGVAIRKRRIFVVATRGCDEHALRRVEQAAAEFNRTPVDAATVRSCLDDTTVDIYWYNGRHRPSPCVRSTDLPSPTLRSNCMSPPSAQYQFRPNDAGSVGDAHVLSVQEMARVSSFPSHYFDCTNTPAAARSLGNCVPPRMAEVVARLCLEVMKAPVSSIERPICVVALRRRAQRISRLHRLVDLGVLDMGAVLSENGTLIYLGGASRRGDAIVERVLGFLPELGWRVQLRPRLTVSGNAPLDDLCIYTPEATRPFRSSKQLHLSLGA
jgi:DNA (cytosine-5)-methyltransferase 1